MQIQKFMFYQSALNPAFSLSISNVAKFYTRLIMLICIYTACSRAAKAQTPLTSYTTVTTATSATTLTSLNGHINGGNTHIHRAGNTFNAIFGTKYQTPANVAATTKNITGFAAGGNNYTFIGASLTRPFTKATMNRVNNVAFTGNQFSGFFEYSSVRTAAGVPEYRVGSTPTGNNLTMYITPSVLYTMEDVLNNFTLSYGSDNLFSNGGTGNAGSQVPSPSTIYSTGNNIERVDFVYQPGIGATTATSLQRLGFVINERGGNDVFKIAAITGINASGTVTSLGSVLSVTTAGWGQVGPAVSTVVFMGAEGAGNIRPKELVGMAAINTDPPVTQTVSGTFISLSNLGIAVNTRIYGVAIFPGDITANYLTLSGTPTNTPDAGNGGLDLMSGNGLARSTTNFDVLAQTLSGKVWNDVNGDGVDNGAAEANVSGNNTSSGGSITAGSNLFVNIVVAGVVVASVPVNADGTYTYNGMLPNTAYTLVLTTAAGTIGSPVSPSKPAGWGNTADNQNGTVDAATAGQVAFTSPFGMDPQPNVINQDFGLQQLPESAVNLQVIGLNPGSTVNTTVNPSWFQASNVGANPNTQDYSGGTVSSIRITAFPSNATSITINGVSYTSGTWPAGGVIVPAPGGVPSQTITVDPVDGVVNVVIPFVAIDNAGAEDPTPGSVTLQYTSTLPIKLKSFTAAIVNNHVELHWEVTEEINVKYYAIEWSVNGASWTIVGTRPAENTRNYNLTDSRSLSGANYYRLRSVDRDGQLSYSDIRIVNMDKTSPYIAIYPNPARINVNISFPPLALGKAAVISIMGTDGKAYIQKRVEKLSQAEIVNAGMLVNGTYIVRIAMQDDIIYKKIEVVK